MKQGWVAWLLITLAAACVGVAVGFGVSQLSDGAAWMTVFAVVAGVEAAIVFIAVAWFFRRESASLNAREASPR
jgi:chromate transport protein ChrA